MLSCVGLIGAGIVIGSLGILVPIACGIAWIVDKLRR